MWSRKPTPVVRLPAPEPSSAEAQLDAVSSVSRVISARRLTPRAFSRTSIEAAWTDEALGPAIGAPARGERARRVADAHLAHAPAEVARADSPEAKRAAPPVGSVWLEPAT